MLRRSFLSQAFESFYHHLMRHRQTIISGEWQHNTLPQDKEDDLSEHRYIQEKCYHMYQEFISLLKEQEYTLQKTLESYALGWYKDVQYLMVIFADEVMLNLPWKGGTFWKSHLLEEALYQSHVGGEKFFTQLKDFLHQGEFLKQEVASIYFNVLSLGFRGKFRGFDDQGLIEKYKKALFVFIYLKEPEVLSAQTPLFPQALMHTVQSSPEKAMLPQKLWRKLGYIFLILYVGGASLTWLMHVNPLLQALQIFQRQVFVAS